MNSLHEDSSILLVMPKKPGWECLRNPPLCSFGKAVEGRDSSLGKGGRLRYPQSKCLGIDFLSDGCCILMDQPEEQ
jgi:hypothetical protein